MFNWNFADDWILTGVLRVTTTTLKDGILLKMNPTPAGHMIANQKRWGRNLREEISQKMLKLVDKWILLLLEEWGFSI